ncbi:MAG: lamin tail domain-containing protein, partial [Patescibacteria group bacterium]
MKKPPSIFMLITLIASTLLGTLSPIFISGTWAGQPDHLVINEVLYDPLGSDLGYEFIELYNPTNQAVDLSNWVIEVAGTSFSEATTVPEGALI